jgi:hypothetical protein
MTSEMDTSRITINGQSYDSPDAMPPDVRRTYEEAMRMLGPSLAGGQGSETTEVQSGPAGFGVQTNIVVRKKITVKDRTYGSVDEMPPEVRRVVEEQLQNAGGSTAVTPVKPGVHVWLEIGKSRARTTGDSSTSPLMPADPIEPTEARMHNLVTALGTLVLGGIVLWILFGR